MIIIKYMRKILSVILAVLISYSVIASSDILFPFIMSWEGSSYANVPGDKGGSTKYGVTIATWKAYGDGTPLKNITLDKVHNLIYVPHFWNVCKADSIKSQAIANIIVDWQYNAGNNAIKQVQKVLEINPDGKIGKQTLEAINTYGNDEELFNKIKEQRISYYKRIAERNPSQKKFLKGWLNRTNSIYYDKLICNGGFVIYLS